MMKRFLNRKRFSGDNAKTIIRVVLGTVLVTIMGVAHAKDKVVVIPLFGEEATKRPVIQILPESRDPALFQVAESGDTVIDLVTKLEWQRDTHSTVYTWTEAIKYCALVVLNEKKDWRLPTISELESLVDYGKFNPAIASTQFTNVRTNKPYWSSSTYGSDQREALDVEYRYGKTNSTQWVASNTGYVRCVR